MILRIHHAQITVPEGAEEEARGFYCGLLEVPEPDFDRSVTKAHLAYEVDDLNCWRLRPAEQGVQALEGVSIPGYDRFEFRDPFGNRVEFIQGASNDNSRG